MTFVHEFRLKTTASDRKKLDKILDLCRIQYNAYLRAIFDYREAMTQHPDYLEAQRLRESGAKKAEYTPLYRKATREALFTEFDAINLVAKTRKSFFAESVPSKVCSALAKRAFTAVSEFHYGGRGRPFFRPKRMQLTTIPNSGDCGIRFRYDKKTDKFKILFNDLDLDIAIDKLDIYQNEILYRFVENPKSVSYTQLNKKIINNKAHWYAQVTFKIGAPPMKHDFDTTGNKVAFDIGTTTIAIVHKDGVILKDLVEDVDFIELDLIEDKIARIQQALDVKRREVNQDLYNPDGTIKKGSKGKFITSKNMQVLENKIKTLRRKQAAHRKNMHGRLANQIVALGSVIHCEKIDYRQWQKDFGKQIGNRAPSMLVQMIKNKVLSNGGQFIEIDTKTTKFSQTCHNCDRVEKKPLYVRVHDCDCGVFAHRDLYSALLAYAYDPDTKKLNREEASLMYEKLGEQMAKEMLNYNVNKCLTI